MRFCFIHLLTNNVETILSEKGWFDGTLKTLGLNGRGIEKDGVLELDETPTKRVDAKLKLVINRAAKQE